MKIVKYISLLLIIETVIFLSCKYLCQHNLKYQIINKRFYTEEIGSDLKEYIDDNTRTLELPVENISTVVDSALKRTAKKLKFTTTQISNSPVDLYDTGKAHCVGYASLYCAICNQLLKQNGLYKTWRAEQVVGKLFF